MFRLLPDARQAGGGAISRELSYGPFMRYRLTALALWVAGAATAAPRFERTPLLHADRHDISPPLALMDVPAQSAEPDEREDRGPRRVPHTQLTAPAHDPVLQDYVLPVVLPQAGLNFDGVGSGFLGVNRPPFDTGHILPPDPNGDVGASHYVQIVNSSFAVFTKDGKPAFGPVPTRLVFSGFGPPCETHDDGDGVVLYDPLADRWLISQLGIARNSDKPYNQCIAVSSSGDPTGSWARYVYSYKYFNDYPKFGVWPDAYYSTYNLYRDPDSDQFVGRLVCAFDRAKMLSGAPAAQQCFNVLDDVSGLIPADLDGSLPPPEGDRVAVIGFSASGSALMLYRFHVDWSNPNDTDLDSTSVPVAPFADACFTVRQGLCIPQLGAGNFGLDSLGDRMMYRAAYRNLGQRQALIVNHSVAVNQVSGIRWYEIRDPAGDPVLVQQGTYAPDSSFRWLGSAAMDRVGNIALGFSITSPTTRPGIGYTGHAAADPPGVMGQGELTAMIGPGTQSGSSRWGDYSSMSVDPADECTFWYTNQYIGAEGGQYAWHTRVFNFQLAGCASGADYAIWPVPDVQPVGPGRVATVSIASAALRPSAAQKALALSLALPNPPPNGISVSIAPPTLSPGATATLTVSAAAGTELGSVPVIISAAAADGTSRTASAQVNVVDSDFTLLPERMDMTIAAGVTTMLRIDTKTLFGDPQIVSLAVSQVRQGMTATFDRPEIMSGESAMLSIAGAVNLPASNSSITVTATGASTTHKLRLHVRGLEAPHVSITWPGPQAPVSGNAEVVASAVTSPNTTLRGIELYVDDKKIDGVFSATSPAILNWNSHLVSDGTHNLTVRATDRQGGTGDSQPVSIWVQNKGDCGCAQSGGGWESLGLFALLAALRRRRRS